MTEEGPSRMRFDAVLPVASCDLARASLLIRSLARFELRLEKLRVVVPDDAVDRFAGELDRSVPWELVPESKLVGAVVVRSGLRGALRRALRRDWYVQQIAKLAAVADPGPDFCLVLDADALLIRRPVRNDFVTNEGRARTVVLGATRHRIWYARAGSLLDVPRSRTEFGVTPAVLHRATCREMLARLGSRGSRRRGGGDWRARLQGSIGWSEYALYFTWAVWSGAFELYHTPVAYDDWFAPSVWKRADWEGWRPETAAAAPGAPLFAVVQSSAGVDPAEVAARITGSGVPRPGRRAAPGGR